MPHHRGAGYPFFKGKCMKIARISVAFVLATFIITLSANAADKAAAMKAGEAVYKKYCTTCHQPTGAGLANVYPPLAKSDYLKTKDKKIIIDEVVNGLKGEITVNGKKYNNVMTPLPKEYSDEDAANAITYVMNSWGNSGPVITAAEVKKVRKAAGTAPAKAATPAKKK